MKKLILYLATISIIIVACNNNENGEKSDSFQKQELTEDEIATGILTPEILWKFGRIGEFQISPNKENIVYTITYYDVKTNSSKTQLYITNTNGNKAIEKATNNDFSCYNPRWINNTDILYLSDVTGKSEIWRMSINNTKKEKISEIKPNINAFEISPDNNKILFSSDVKLDDTPQDIYADLPLTNVIIANDLMYRHWNSWHDYNYSHIFVSQIKDNRLTEIIDIMENEKFDSPLSPYFDMSEITWSPDGNSIAYTCKKMSGKEYAISTNSDIYVYNLTDNTTKNITEGMMGYDRHPVFSKDGNKIAWSSMETDGYESDKNRLFIMDLQTNEKIDLTENFDFNANEPLWSEYEDTIIFFLSEINGTVQVFKINTETKKISQITKGWYDYIAIQNAENNCLIATKMSMQKATEIFKITADYNEQQITFINQKIYDNIKTCEIKQHWIKTSDNKEMLTWVILPPNFDSTKVYPAILYCGGGPQSQVSQFFSYRWNFQLMASNGYVVIAPNRRGLPGFGTKWNEQISGDYGGQNMEDYISAVEVLKKEPYIDEDRIGAVGASYGGFSVFWLAGHNQNNLFKAFIAHCGMFNLESQYGATEETFFVNYDLGGPYWDKKNTVAQKSYASSPHRFVQNWTTPILIISGEKDFRIPYTESLQAFNCAQLSGVESKLLIFPEETHFVLKPQNSILWQREFKSWLDKYLK